MARARAGFFFVLGKPFRISFSPKGLRGQGQGCVTQQCGLQASPFIIYSYLYPQVGIQIMKTDTRSLTKAHAIGVSLRHSRDWYLLISIEVEVLGRRSPCVVIGRSLSASASHFVLDCLARHVNERHP